MICPGCGHPVDDHPEDGCVLGALIRVLRDRGSLDEQELLKLHSEADIDGLWADIGPILDRLEDGGYSYPEG